MNVTVVIDGASSSGRASCDLGKLERREILRGHRRISLARSQFLSVYKYANHDLKTAPTSKPVATCVDELTTTLSNKYYAHA